MNPSPAIGNTISGNNAGDAVLWAAGSISTATYTQNYNRYSYAWNNPLKFFDPSGYINQYPDEGSIPTRNMDGAAGPDWSCKLSQK